MAEHDAWFLLSAYLDGELTKEERPEVESHLSGCGSCRAELASLREAKHWAAAAPRRAVPPELLARLENLEDMPRGWARLLSWLPRPRLAVPAGAVGLAAILLGAWLGFGRERPDAAIPLDSLLAAHARSKADALVPHGDIIASNFYNQLANFDAEE